MTPHMKWAIAGIVVGLILLVVSPWLALALIVAAIAIPTAAYLMLDEQATEDLLETARTIENVRDMSLVADQLAGPGRRPGPGRVA